MQPSLIHQIKGLFDWAKSVDQLSSHLGDGKANLEEEGHAYSVPECRFYRMLGTERALRTSRW